MGGVSSWTSINLADRFPWLDSNTLKSDNYVESEVAAPVGTAFVDGQEVALNPDGSITLSDGTTIPMNPDGTITLPNDVIISPRIDLGVYNDAAIQAMLQAILAKLGDLERQLEWEKDIPLADTTVDIAYEGTLSEFIYNSPRWAQVFPFCLPWDFVRGIELLSVNPVAPVFVIPFDVPEFGLFDGFHSEIVLDFSKYDSYFYVVRWLSTVIFVMSLIFISFKIVKGVR